jgi:hypothetical protein
MAFRDRQEYETWRAQHASSDKPGPAAESSMDAALSHAADARPSFDDRVKPGLVDIELGLSPLYVGELARLLVKKAAKSASNLVALGATLADQIPDEEGRRAFRAAVRARAK